MINPSWQKGQTQNPKTFSAMGTKREKEHMNRPTTRKTTIMSELSLIDEGQKIIE
jgi:hypothetical protein